MWQENRTPVNKNTLNNITQKVKREIQKIRNKTVESYLKELTADNSTDYSLWKTAKNLRRPISQSVPIKKEDGTWAKNEQ